MELAARIGTMASSEKYAQLVESLNALAGTITVDTVRCDELNGYVGSYFVNETFKGRVLILNNILGGSSQWEFSRCPNLEYFEANNIVRIAPSGIRSNKKLKTLYLDSLTTLGSSLSLAENDALENLYIRKNSAEQLVSWTSLLGRIPTACIVHGSDADVMYINGAWTIVQRDTARGGGGTKCLTRRRVPARFSRPSARFCAHSQEWEVAA